MERLSDLHPLVDFHTCQICGVRDDDICTRRMWWEMDENDKVVPGDVIVTCACNDNDEGWDSEHPCAKRVDESPRGYDLIPWGQGGAGHFMLKCEDCPSRSGTLCMHPDLTANGGEGLEVRFGNSDLGGIIHFNDGRPPMSAFPHPVVWCAGKGDV